MILDWLHKTLLVWAVCTTVYWLMAEWVIRGRNAPHPGPPRKREGADTGEM